MKFKEHIVTVKRPPNMILFLQKIGFGHHAHMLRPCKLKKGEIARVCLGHHRQKRLICKTFSSPSKKKIVLD